MCILCIWCVCVAQKTHTGDLVVCDLPGRGVTGTGVCDTIGLAQAHFALKGAHAAEARPGPLRS
jgi:hypothetical protein